MHLNDDINRLLIAMNHPALPGIDLTLTRMMQLLDALGNPERRLPPVIHVAGTNGKGSVIAYLRAMYQAAGYRVHVYTSPHLVRFNERIVLANHEIDDAALLRYLQRIAEVSRTIPVTFFEATTAAAFLAFAENLADIVLLETGLGGRLDATNVVPHPLCTVITPIDYDHTEFLGESLAKIAAEKAGILRPAVPCVSAAQQPEAAEVLFIASRGLQASLALCDAQWNFNATASALQVSFAGDVVTLPLPHLAGVHQVANAALAAKTVLTCATALPVPLDAMAQGIAQAQWPARLQRLTHGAWVDAWPAPIWLDGGHNAHAARALAVWLATQPQPVAMIAAMMQRKNAVEYFAALAPHLAALVCIPIPGDEASAGYTPTQLAANARTAGVGQVGEAADMQEALALFREMLADRHPPLLIAGSLYLAGDVLKNHS